MMANSLGPYKLQIRDGCKKSDFSLEQLCLSTTATVCINHFLLFMCAHLWQQCTALAKSYR